MGIIKFQNVTKSYDGITNVVKSIDLEIKSGDFVTLIGESGCGKTTMLKMVNGLVKTTSGQITIMDKKVDEWNLIDLRRNIGYVIQQIGLFPHLTVEKNISYVLDIIGVEESKRVKRAIELVDLVGLDKTYLNKYPRQLSGGQQQRVGVARALAADPDIILMDEPFGAVDEITRKVLQDEMLKIHEKLGKTILFVTHDIEEAIKLGSCIILFNEGKIEQNGTREEMIFKPKSEYVKKFFGLKNFIAYLHVVEIKHVIKTITLDEKQFYIEQNVKAIEQNAPILEAVKALFDYSLKDVPVKNEKNEIVGKFDLGATKEILIGLMEKNNIE